MKNFYIYFLILFYLSCSTNESQAEFIIKIDDSIVTLEEFLMRSEYTIRPKFCQGNTKNDKGLIIKNLLLEKLISKRSQNENIKLSESQKNYISGREKQAMRQLLYSKVISDSINIIPNQINSKINLIGREYDLSYIQMANNYEEIPQVLDSWTNDSLLTEKYPRIPVFNKILKWNEHEQIEILDSLYSTGRKIGEIVGPFSIGKFYMFVKINGWSNNPAITEGEIKFRKTRISDFILKSEGEKVYLNYIKSLMKGNDLHFKKEGFTKLINYFGMRLKMTQNKIIDMKSQYNHIFSSMDKSSELNKEELLFQIGDEFWSIDRLFENIKTHPLVFRKYKMQRSEFPEQLKLAIGDLVRDYYLTKKSEEFEYDKDSQIIQQNVMWTDYFLAQNYLKTLFPEAKSSNDWLEDDEFQNGLSELLIENAKKVEINWDIIQNTKITNIPFHAIYPKEPYPNVVAELLPISKTKLDSIFID